MLTKLRFLFGEQLKVSFVMSGLVQDIRNFQDPANGISGSNWYAQIASHWDEAARRHGMPVDSAVWYDIKNGFTSTYPASIAVKAAELCKPALGNLYLRRLREAAAAERKAIHELDVACAIAEDVGIDSGQMRSTIEDGKATAAFEKDLAQCRRLGVRGFPTFIFSNREGNKYSISGYRPYHMFEQVIRKLASDSLGQLREVDGDMDILGVAELNGSITVREAMEVFNMSPDAAIDTLDSLVQQGFLQKEDAGSGFLYRILAAPACSADVARAC